MLNFIKLGIFVFFLYMAYSVGMGLWKFVNLINKQTTAAQAKINISATPKTGTFAPGSKQTITFIIQPADSGKKMSGIDITFLATGALKIIDVATPATFPGNNSSVFTQITKQLTQERTRISHVITLATDQLPTAAKIVVTVQGEGNGSGSLTIDKSSLQIVGNVPGYAYEAGNVDEGLYGIGTGTVPTAASQPTQAQSPTNVYLNIKARLQGIKTSPLGQNKNIILKVTVVNKSDGGKKTYMVSMNPDSQGSWSGRTALDVNAGPGYYALIKGQSHLQRKICDKAPADKLPSLYHCGSNTINFNTGENTLDLKNIVLFAGDITGAAGNQDGVIDSVDVAYVRDNFGNTGIDTLSRADINMDGVVDTQDYSLMIASLSNKKDEE